MNSPTKAWYSSNSASCWRSTLVLSAEELETSILKKKLKRKNPGKIRDTSCGSFPMEAPITVRFRSKLENSLYYCLAFGLKLKEHNLPASTAGKRRLFQRIQEQNVRNGILSELKNRFPSLSNAGLIDIENSLQIRLNIFSRAKNGTRLGPAVLARLSDYGTGDDVPTFNLFSTNIDEDSNFCLKSLNFIVDKDRFLQKNSGKMNGNRIFEILAKEKNPELEGRHLLEKELEYQKLWNYPTVSICDHRRFYNLFGYGIEIWISARNRKRVETFKVLGSIRSKTIRIRLKGTLQFHEFSIHQLRSNLIH